MDQGQGSTVPASETQGAETGGHPYTAALEGVLRLHNLMEPERLLPQVPDVLRAVLGDCSGALVLRQSGRDTVQSFGGFAEDAVQVPHARAAVDKTMESMALVFDGQGDGRHVAVPLGAGNRCVGALYVAVQGPERRMGDAYLDLLGLLGRQIGSALHNGAQARDLAMVSAVGSEEAVPAGLSLRESKRLYERRLVKSRLAESRGNIAAAARSLDMDRGQLSRLLKKHGVDKTEFKRPAR